MRANNLAYIDSIRSGLVPCKPIQLSGGDMKVIVTANRYAYKRGEIVETSCNWIIPRRAVFHRKSSTFPTILPYRWYVDEHNTIQFALG